MADPVPPFTAPATAATNVDVTGGGIYANGDGGAVDPSTAGSFSGPWFDERQGMSITYWRYPYGVNPPSLAASDTTLSGQTQFTVVAGTDLMVHIHAWTEKMITSGQSYPTSSYYQSQKFRVNAYQNDMYGNNYGLVSGTRLGPMGSVQTCSIGIRRVDIGPDGLGWTTGTGSMCYPVHENVAPCHSLSSVDNWSAAIVKINCGQTQWGGAYGVQNWGAFPSTLLRPEEKGAYPSIYDPFWLEKIFPLAGGVCQMPGSYNAAMEGDSTETLLRLQSLVNWCGEEVAAIGPFVVCGPGNQYVVNSFYKPPHQFDFSDGQMEVHECDRGKCLTDYDWGWHDFT